MVARTALTAIAAYVRPRRRQIIWSIVLAGAGAGMLVAAHAMAGFGRDIMINVGASVLMVALSFIVFDPIFEDMRRNAVEEHRTLNQDQLITQFAAARDIVEIMETWTGLLEERYRTRFLAAVRQALGNGVPFRFLLLDPDSSAAAQRAEELHHAQVQVLIVENLRHLYELKQTLEPELSALLEVRVYDASPSIQLYRWDDKAFISFFPVGTRAYDARQIEAFMSSPLGEFVASRFEDLWGNASTRPLDDFMTLHLTVLLDGEELTRAEAPFVRLGNWCYIDGTAIAEHLIDFGALRLSIATLRPLAVGDWMGSSFDMVRVDPHDRPRQADVVALFDIKYGGTHDHSRILRLVPRPARSEPVSTGAGRLEP